MTFPIVELISDLFESMYAYKKQGIAEVLEKGTTEHKIPVSDTVDMLSDNVILEENQKLRLEIGELNRQELLKNKRITSLEKSIKEYKDRLEEQSATYAKNIQLMANKNLSQEIDFRAGAPNANKNIHSLGEKPLKVANKVFKLPDGYSVKEYCMLLVKLANSVPIDRIKAESSVVILTSTVREIENRHEKYINGLKCRKGSEREQYFDSMRSHFEKLQAREVQ